jgi:hypothetical protein
MLEFPTSRKRKRRILCRRSRFRLVNGSPVSARRANMNAWPSLLTFVTSQPWIIPAIGVLAASFAFLAGRRFAARPAPPEKTVEQPATTFRSMTAANAKQPQQDRRSAPRRKAGNRVEVFLTTEPEAAPTLGWVVDRSMGGLCLNVEEPLSEGTILNIRPRKAPQTAPWLAIEIRSCRPEGSTWEIGCRFIKPPQWNDLLLFG